MYKITKIAENNIEILESKTLTDINGQEFEVWDETTKQSYGQSRLDRELESANKQNEDANKFNEVEYKQKLKDDAQEKIDRLTAIQLEMDK